MRIADWSQAPEWAEWHAVDGDGLGFWYKDKPVAKGVDSRLIWALQDGPPVLPSLQISGHFDIRTNAVPDQLLERRPEP